MITIDKLYKWTEKAKRGDRIEYYTGELSKASELERIYSVNSSCKFTGEVTKLRNAVWGLYEDGEVTMVQKVRGVIDFERKQKMPVMSCVVKDYEYFAIKL